MRESRGLIFVDGWGGQVFVECAGMGEFGGGLRYVLPAPLV